MTMTPHLWPRDPEKVSQDFDVGQALGRAGQALGDANVFLIGAEKSYVPPPQRYDPIRDHFHPRRGASVPRQLGEHLQSRLPAASASQQAVRDTAAVTRNANAHLATPGAAQSAAAAGN